MWHVALAVQRTTDVDVIAAFDVKDGLRVAREWPISEAGQVQLVRVAR